jgi:TonB family protein
VLELDPKPTEAPRKIWQRRQLWLALALLFLAFVGLLVREREFWFGPETDSDVVGPDIPQPNAKPIATVTPATTTEKAKAQPAAGKPQQASAKPATPAPTPESGAVASDRTPIPPLDIEVVTGDKHSKLHPGSTAANVVIASGQTASVGGPSINAAERAPLATTIPLPGSLVEGSYPVLAQQMKVQASVVLQALIGADGLIQNLSVLTGPPILATAAQEAVRPWHFKPYLQNGQPVETKAKITVNFTIRVADTSVSGS